MHQRLLHFTKRPSFSSSLVCTSMAAATATAVAGGVPSISLVSSSSSSSSSLKKLHCFTRPSPSKLRISFSATTISLISSSPLLPLSNKKFGFELYSNVQEATVEKTQDEETLKEETPEEENKKKLYVVNIPWTFSVADMKSLFGECGTVKDVEIIKEKDGRNKGFAFVTMASGEEASAVIEKFNSYDISGRTIRVEFSKRFKRPSPPPPAGTPAVETRYKLYVSNLAWKARSTQLREFFCAVSNPVSARVVFDSPSGRSAGYGFVSFTTKEEAESAISALNGKELMGRPVILKFSEKNVDEPGNKPDEDNAEEQQEEAGDAAAKPEEL